jgi:SWIM/SEC-C metal-binding protein
MAKLGSKKKPIVVRVQTEARALEVSTVCSENGWHDIAGIEPDKPEDVSDLDRALNPLTPLQATQAPGRNDPCPCGSGKKYKKCCGS